MSESPASHHILLIEDAEPLAQLYSEYLRAARYVPLIAGTGAAALEALESQKISAILLDLNLPDMDGLEILKNVQLRMPHVPVIVMTAYATVNVAVGAMRAGAYDFILKPFPAERLVITLQNALDHNRLNRMVDTYRKGFTREAFYQFIGGSLVMQAVYRTIESAATSRAPVFITGESGTGKELCAEAVHMASSRRDQPFVHVNCAAIPKEQIDSALFGSSNGPAYDAYTRWGYLQQANHGTVFLDEIIELPLAAQIKLLRFAQTGTLPGARLDEGEKIDVRIISATNRDPLAEVAKGRFREDLYYRLHVIPIAMPALREHREDIGVLAEHFLQLYASEENKVFRNFHPEVISRLEAYEWPGNVRQLQNIIRQIVVLYSGEIVLPQMLPAPLDFAGDQVISPPLAAPLRNVALPGARHGSVSGVSLSMPSEEGSRLSRAEDSGRIRPLWQVELETIETAIAECRGNVTQAASLLGISPSTIYRKKMRPHLDKEGEPAN